MKVREYAVIYESENGECKYLIGISFSKKEALAMVFDTLNHWLDNPGYDNQNEQLQITGEYDKMNGDFYKYTIVRPENENHVRLTDYIYIYKNDCPRYYEKEAEQNRKDEEARMKAMKSVTEAL